MTSENEVLKEVLGELTKERKTERRWKNFFRMLVFIYMFLILLIIHYSMNRDDDDRFRAGPYVGVVEVNGEISESSDSNADSLIDALEDAFKDDRSIGLIIKINSPGGSPVVSGAVYREILRLKKTRSDFPVYAVITELGASGAYYIASAADYIYSDQSSLVGSIGVVGAGFGFVDIMKTVGVERRLYTSGSHKAFLDPFSPVKEEEREFWSGVLKITHDQFIDAVKNGRGNRLKESDELFSGLIWSAPQALELGLIDGFGSPKSVMRDVFDVSYMHKYQKKNVLKDMVEKFGVSIGEGIARETKTEVMSLK